MEMAQESQILVVDDDPRVRSMLHIYLEEEGFKVTGAANGEAMRACMAECQVHLVILDLALPGEDGLSLARELRAASDVPIIIVTGKGDLIDRVTGLEVGADDYITKPFQLREVLARIRAVLRRTRAESHRDRQGTGSREQGDRVQFESWQMDFDKRELRAPDGTLVPLTSGEFNLIQAFTRNPNRVLNRDQLMDLVRGQDWTPFDRSIDTHVTRVRKKIERDPKNPTMIKTVRGVGYIFTPKVEPL